MPFCRAFLGRAFTGGSVENIATEAPCEPIKWDGPLMPMKWRGELPRVNDWLGLRDKSLSVPIGGKIPSMAFLCGLIVI